MGVLTPDRTVRCSRHVLSTFLMAALAAALSVLAHSAFADTVTFGLDIPREDLALALNRFAQQSHIEISYSAELTRGKTSPSLKGTYTSEQALKMLLKGSGLHVRRIAGGALVIEKEGARMSPSGGQSPTSDSDATVQMGEIIVTASKRAQNQREVADSATAFGGNELSRRGAQSFEDYIGCAPGAIFEQAIPGLSNVTIRGVGTTTNGPDQGQGTTGIYLNDIPLTDPSFAVSIPDIDTFDLQRVEVLRGPQGTMFGAAALGGAINYIINPVYLDIFDARLESGVSGTEHSSNVGYTAKEALNLPIVTNVLGIRITAIKRFDPGYLDNIGTGETGSNSSDDEQFRINTLWQVNRQVSVGFFSFYAREESPDQSYALPALGVLKRDTTIPEYTDFVTRINSLKVDADFDFATLTLSGAHTQKSKSSQLDFTTYFGPNASVLSYPTTHMTTLEVRLTSPNGRTIEWLAGVYHGVLHENYPTPAIRNGQVLEVVTSDYLSDETSEFGEATYRFSDQWRVTLGARYYDISLRTTSILGAPAAPQISAGRDVGRGLSPKGSITYEPSSDFLAYALVSKGYRSGGVNLNIPPLAGFPTPATYGPDSLVNYEVGVRPSWFNHQLTLDSTLFFINWTNIQLRLGRPDGYAYATNAGGAHNFGLENALNWRATPNLQFQLSATFLQARISKTTDLGNGVVLPEGARIPGAPHWSAWGLATYHWNVEYEPYLAVSARFISGAQSNFTDTRTPSLPIMDYGVVDLRSGFKVKRYDLSLYLDNVADRRGVTAAYYGGDGPDPNDDRDFYIRPRTFGLRLDWHL
jgi:iron complex outermembrane receptor protein